MGATIYINVPFITWIRRMGINVGTWNGVSAQPDYVKQFDDADLRKKGSFLMGPMIDPSTGQVLITAHARQLIHTVDLTSSPAPSERECGVRYIRKRVLA